MKKEEREESKGGRYLAKILRIAIKWHDLGANILALWLILVLIRPEIRTQWGLIHIKSFAYKRDKIPQVYSFLTL